MGEKVVSPDFTDEEKREAAKKIRDQEPEKTAEDAHEIFVQIKDGMRQIIKYVESSAYHCALVNIANIGCRLTLSVDGEDVVNYGFEPAAEDGDGE